MFDADPAFLFLPDASEVDAGLNAAQKALGKGFRENWWPALLPFSNFMLP
ncbi:hypothetical protein [Paracidovorax valerianellae]|nr:hypothetical protein [Paracidovorax valerianellae]MDA8447155.1 hypothetical protein [Paracidovorax valerianellae]